MIYLATNEAFAKEVKVQRAAAGLIIVIALVLIACASPVFGENLPVITQRFVAHQSIIEVSSWACPVFDPGDKYFATTLFRDGKPHLKMALEQLRAAGYKDTQLYTFRYAVKWIHNPRPFSVFSADNGERFSFALPIDASVFDPTKSGSVTLTFIGLATSRPSPTWTSLVFMPGAYPSPKHLPRIKVYGAPTGVSLSHGAIGKTDDATFSKLVSERYERFLFLAIGRQNDYNPSPFLSSPNSARLLIGNIETR
ncbi:MAG: hypothetical protein WC797_00640 [Candidatus Paceibacterota bacterium]